MTTSDPLDHLHSDADDYWTESIKTIMPRVSDTNLTKLRELIEEALTIELSEVEVVETIDAYGLTITLDANANAVTIRSENGLIP
jgi:hypothetical protein